MYGVKYRIQYKRRSNNTSTIDILKRDYLGGITTLLGNDNPLEITYEGDYNNIFQPSVGSGAVIRVLAEPLSLTELFTSDPQQFVVKCYNGASGSNLFWQGFVSTSIYSEDYSSSQPVPIEIQCSDGIRVLEYYSYKPVESGTTLYSGSASILEVLRNIQVK